MTDIKDNSENKEIMFSDEEYNKMVAEQKADRMKSLRRHKLPAKLTLTEALNALTKSELEDIQYNLNLPVATNINKVKKAEMVEAVLPEVINFSRRWFVSVLEDQKELFDYACKQQGMAGELQLEDHRLDYLRGIGIMYCGLSDGKLLWYMPKELQKEYEKINNAAFQQAVTLNSEVMRLAAGLVFYYGVMDYDRLYAKICDYIDDELEFSDFIGIIFNGGCWYNNVVVGKHELRYFELINMEALQQEQMNRPQLDYADIPYDKVWDAGQEAYIESTGAYRALAQFMMDKCDIDVLQAAEAVRSITVIIQNGYGMKEIVGFLREKKLVLPTVEDTQELYGLIGRYNNTLPLWVLKGHTPDEVQSTPQPAVVRAGKKVGRNDPCPCGSGKKYKNCCLDKNY
ncbi:SEC-C metal-binding domain-containing protein [Anaerovibrio sp.]|uniref:YecA family protein n=1 Tax=Anaerovibrio sp. TaxID=1872532 RepID=UPI0025E77279|nr:SEC-C metal-binding domain-containing protein [Anaerovibrio sp.]